MSHPTRPRSLAWSVVLALWVLLARAAAAQTPGPEPFAITDNSFLVEEAFNQERGVFQNIFTWTQSSSGSWAAAFTQEWPVPAMRHQLSYTVPFGEFDPDFHWSAIVLNYRYQVLEEGPGRPAFSPRVSAIVRTGSFDDESNRSGVQVNLPFSKQQGDLYFHWNAGFTWLAEVPDGASTTSLFSPQVAGSVIWRLRQMLNPMLEGVAMWQDDVDGVGGTIRNYALTVSPGLRGGWNFGDKQMVIGAAVPVTFSDQETTAALLMYFSYELPFRKLP